MIKFRAHILTSTFLTAVVLMAGAAHAQTTSAPTCPPGSADGAPGCTPPAAPTVSPPDNSATPSAPDTTTSAAGQTTIPSTNASGETVRQPEDIVITGSRIPQPNLTSASPVTVLSSQEFKLQGTTRTEDLINSLPQSFAAQGSNINNGSTGIASINLRGLGSNRTLVLINGRRLQGGDPITPVADINFIPEQLVKRVDVLTGGASSVYGADAVAGVVNFIMDTNFRGFRIDGQASVFNHDNHTNSDVLAANAARGFRPPTGMSTDGGAQDISVSFGAGFDDNRGSVLAYATYRKQAAVLQSARDFSFCGLSARPAPVGPRSVNCSGSATSANGTFITNIGTFQVQGNQFVPGSTPFNFGPFNFYQRPDERYTLGAFAEYEIAPGAKPYMEAMFMDDQSVSQGAPSGDFFSTNSINCDNPLLSAQQRSIICDPANTFVDANGIVRGIAYIGRRNVEGGSRDDDLEHLDFRVVAGVRGDLLRGLSYDTYYQFGTARRVETFINDISTRRLNQALDVVADPTTGLPVCRGTLNGTADVGCVPYNIFQTGGVTPAAVAFLSTPGFQRGNVNETVANANLTLTGEDYGLQTPWSDRGVGVNVGAEYRKEALRFRTDSEFSSGDLAGQGGPIVGVSGQFDVRELFTEVQVPIVSHSFFEELTLTGGYRYSDYKVAGNHFNTDTYKVSAEFAPIRDIRARASYNRAVRAPNVVELFAPQSVGLAGSTDPCAGPAPSATPEQCALTGVSAAQYGRIVANPAGQYNSLVGGNANLSPETADSYTAGLVLQPRFIPGLALTADYFDIKVKDVIGTIGYNTIITQCIQTGDPFFCSRIKRANGSGSLFIPVQNVANGGFIVDIISNVGRLRTKGIDVNGSYARRLGGLGTLNLSFVGTYLKQLEVTPFSSISFDCAGFYGLQCGTPNPKWRHKFRAGFTLPDGIGISGQWRHFSAVRDDTLSSDPDLAIPPIARPFDEKLNAQNYFDLTLTARLADKYNFRVGVNNIFDNDPPLASGNASGAYGARAAGPLGNGNTFPQVYDSLGRFLFAGVTVDF